MLNIILLITAVSLISLLIGFFEIKIPFFTSDILERFHSSHKRLTKHTRKILHKKIWNNQMHKGFVELPTKPEHILIKK